MLEPLAVDGLLARGALRVAGETVIEQQLELAIAAGVKRILLLADRRTLGVDDLVALASDAKLDVRVVADAPGLCAEVTAADDLLVFGDALLADPVLALPVLQGNCVVTVPIEAGLRAGFERIDAENAWGGILVVPGALVERLRQLPRDCDVASSLLRIALMAGVTVRTVDVQALTDRRWVIVRSEAEAQAIEAQRLRLSLEQARGRTPGARLAGLIVGRFGSRLFEADRSPALVWWASLVPVLAGLVFTGIAMSAAALLCLALAWLTVRGAMILQAAERQGRISAAMPDRKPLLVLLGLDIFMLVALALGLTNWTPGQMPDALEPWFGAVVWVSLIRMGEALFPLTRVRPFFEDRFTQCAVLAIAVWLGWLAPLLMGVTMVTMVVWAGHVAIGRNSDEN